MRYAKDKAITQKDNKKIATRVLENGIKINIRIGDTIIPGTLNDSETSKAFCARLPLSTQMSNSGLDFCGRLLESLPYDEKQVHNGWLKATLTLPQMEIGLPYYTQVKKSLKPMAIR